MGFWDQQGQPAIMAAVEAACESVAESLAKEMRERDQTRHAFLAEEVDRLKAGAVRATELEKDNQSLTREIKELREKLKNTVSLPADRLSLETHDALPTPRLTLSGRLGTRQPLGELPLNVVTGTIQTTKPLDPDTSVLEKEHAELLARYASLEKRFEAKRVASRTIKDQRDAWIKYAESLEKKVDRLEKRFLVNEKGEISTPAIQRTSGDVNETTSSDNLSLVRSFVSNPEQSSGPSLRPEAVEELTSSGRAVSIPATHIPQRTTGRSEQGVDVPRLAEEETWSGNDTEQPDDLPQLPGQTDEVDEVRVKQEPSSDGLLVVSERRLHKRKSVGDDFRLPPARRVKAEHDDSSDPIVTGEAAMFCPHSDIDLDAGQGEVRTLKKLRHSEVETPANNAIHQRRRRPLQEISTGVGDALPTPLPSATRPSDTVDSRRSNAASDKALANGVAELAEDTPVMLRPASSKTGRLQLLLNHAPSENDAAIPLRTPAARDTPRLAATTNVSKNQSASKRRLETAVYARTPQSRTLRERPVSELRIEDFKINPNSNNGHKHAFNEVVRNRAERAELEGCTDPNCCGRAFTMMAQSELDFGGLDILKKPENIKLLEDYLGDEAYKLGMMPMDEKKELWLVAKTKDYANRLGKHRHRYGRPPSPPGYWNPDFPTTQEVKDNRKEGEEMERNMVEERRREAMRGGGRWLFRDE